MNTMKRHDELCDSYGAMPFHVAMKIIELETELTELRSFKQRVMELEPEYFVWDTSDYPSHWERVEKSEFDRTKCDDDKMELYDLKGIK